MSIRNTHVTINEIIARDLIIGTITRESVECFMEEKYLAAISLLFILAEQSVKYSIDKMSGNYYSHLKIAKQKGILNEAEYKILDDLRIFRNKMFHENLYAWHFIYEDVAYPFSESSTHKIIYEIFSPSCFEVILKLLTYSNNI